MQASFPRRSARECESSIRSDFLWIRMRKSDCAPQVMHRTVLPAISGLKSRLRAVNVSERVEGKSFRAENAPAFIHEQLHLRDVWVLPVRDAQRAAFVQRERPDACFQIA